MAMCSAWPSSAHSPSLLPCLQRAVETMVKDAATALAKMPADKRPPPELQRPLIRLKVEHSGYGVLSNQRFGAM